MKGKHQVWSCKIGILGDCLLPLGADWPMREAIRQAFREVTGLEPEFVFSGWNAGLSELEERCLEAGEQASADKGAP